jgi:hypothetical protein
MKKEPEKVLMDGVTGAERRFWILRAAAVVQLAIVWNVPTTTTPFGRILARLAAS